MVAAFRFHTRKFAVFQVASPDTTYAFSSFFNCPLIGIAGYIGETDLRQKEGDRARSCAVTYKMQAGYLIPLCTKSPPIYRVTESPFGDFDCGIRSVEERSIDAVRTGAADDKRIHSVIGRTESLAYWPDLSAGKESAHSFVENRSI